LLILLGAPGAHVWLRDASVRLSPTAAALALTAAPMAALYGLGRAFSGEPMLSILGVAMALGAGPLALAADDLRRSLACGAVSAWGVAAALIGLTAPQALAGAAALAFMTALALCGAILAAGAVVSAAGTASARRLAGGVGRAMPLTALFFIIAGLSLVGWPGLGGHVARAFAFDAAADFGPIWLWPCLLAASAVLMAALVVRLGLVVLSAGTSAEHDQSTPGAAVEPPLLALAFGFAVSVWVGLSPDWLLALTPPEPFSYNPYRLGDIFAAIQILAAGAAAWAAARLVRIAPLGEDLPDIDLVWRAPYPAAAVFIGRIGARLTPWLDARLAGLGVLLGRGLSAAGQVLARTNTGGIAVYVGFVTACVLVLILCLAVYLRSAVSVQPTF
jgi:multicomponent Na+:H+ antiporter subunit D